MIKQVFSAFSSAFGFGRSIPSFVPSLDALVQGGNSYVQNERAAIAKARSGSGVSLPERMYSLFGPPRPPNLVNDQIVSDIIMLPYRSWMDQGNYGRETPAERRDYRFQYRRNPIVHSAIFGSTAGFASADVSVMPNKHGPKRLCNEVADFVDSTIRDSAEGFVGLIENIVSTVKIDGYSICVKKLKEARWRGRNVWGFDHSRQLDTIYLRLQLDVYRNIISIVNMVRGLEYYSPNDVILHTNGKQYNDPFGIPDMTCVGGSRALGGPIDGAAYMFQAAYMSWLLAAEHFGLPYVKGTYGNPTQKQALGQAIEALRSGGYIVVGKDDDVELLNLAGAVGTGMFKDLIDSVSGNMFQGLRGSAQPFMEGDGGKDAHTDTQVQRESSDSWEYFGLLKLCKTIEYQVFPWLTYPNFGYDPDILPTLKLGGVNYDQMAKVTTCLSDAKEKLGIEPGKKYTEDILGIVGPRDDDDRFETDTKQDQDNTPVLNAAMQLMEKVNSRAIGVEQARGALILWFGIDPEWSARLITEPPPQANAAQPNMPAQPNVPAQPAQFSADVMSEWDREAERIIQQCRGSAA